MGNWIQLRSGGGYDFETKNIFGRYSMKVDLAECLDEIVRCGGHAIARWTVAEHSVVVGLAMNTMVGQRAAAAAGLLHDAHEAVIGDITTPVGLELGYAKVKALKADVQSAIEQRLKIPSRCLPTAWLEEVKLADAAALHIERQLFLVPAPRPWTYKEPSPEWAQATYDATMAVLHAKTKGSDLFAEHYDKWVA